MKRIIIAITIGVFALPAFGATRVHGYTKKDGTYVVPHNRTSPNGTQVKSFLSATVKI